MRSSRIRERTPRPADPRGASQAYFFAAFAAFDERAAELAATAAQMSCLKAVASIFSPSRKSIARRVLPPGWS